MEGLGSAVLQLLLKLFGGKIEGVVIGVSQTKQGIVQLGQVWLLGGRGHLKINSKERNGLTFKNAVL